MSKVSVPPQNFRKSWFTCYESKVMTKLLYTFSLTKLETNLCCKFFEKHSQIEVFILDAPIKKENNYFTADFENTYK